MVAPTPAQWGAMEAMTMASSDYDTVGYPIAPGSRRNGSRRVRRGLSTIYDTVGYSIIAPPIGRGRAAQWSARPHPPFSGYCASADGAMRRNGAIGSPRWIYLRQPVAPPGITDRPQGDQLWRILPTRQVARPKCGPYPRPLCLLWPERAPCLRKPRCPFRPVAARSWPAGRQDARVAGCIELSPTPNRRGTTDE